MNELQVVTDNKSNLEKRNLPQDELEGDNNYKSVKNPKLSNPRNSQYPSKEYLFPSPDAGPYVFLLYSTLNENIGGYNTSRSP